MLEDATGLVEQIHGTFLVQTRHDGRSWEVILSPNEDLQLLVIVTAYPSA